MTRLFRILLLSFALTACSNSGTVANENGSSKTLSLPDKVNTLEKRLKESHHSSKTIPATIIESTLNYKDLEKIDYGWPESSTDKYILKKGFEFYSDTVFSEKKISVYRKSEPGEILEISSSHYSTGATSFRINYYTTSKIGYENFINSLSASKYRYNKHNKRYETFMGTYENLCIYTNGQILKNQEMYYRIKYLHDQGKELSSAPITEKHFTKDTIK